MIIGITGDSIGIGKSLKTMLEAQGHTVKGFSRSNGFDISDPAIRNEIIKQSSDCDIFVNNAYAGPAQAIMLKMLIPLWKDTDKLIVNINSKVALAPPVHHPKVQNQSEQIQHFFADYYINKTTQNQIIANTLFMASPKILNVFCGFVDTKSAEFFKAPNKLTADDAAEVLMDLIKYKDRIYIQQITFDALGINYDTVDYDFDAIVAWGLRNDLNI
jgi:hypothetical protein